MSCKNFLRLKSYFFEALAVPLSLPIWLPPSCSLAGSVCCDQCDGSCDRRPLFPALVLQDCGAAAWPHLHWFTFMGFSQNATDLCCWGEQQNLTPRSGVLVGIQVLRECFLLALVTAVPASAVTLPFLIYMPHRAFTFSHFLPVSLT